MPRDKKKEERRRVKRTLQSIRRANEKAMDDPFEAAEDLRRQRERDKKKFKR